MNELIPFNTDDVLSKIHNVRGYNVILDKDVANIYGVETKRVNEAVKNNQEKFPNGYIIELTKEETDSLRSKFSTLEMAVANTLNMQHMHLPKRGFICWQPC